MCSLYLFQEDDEEEEDEFENLPSDEEEFEGISSPYIHCIRAFIDLVIPNLAKTTTTMRRMKRKKRRAASTHMQTRRMMVIRNIFQSYVC